MTDTREYYENRPLAMTAANRGQLKYQEQGCVSATAQLEPNNGFVAVLFCERNIPEAWEEGFEVQLTTFTPSKTPANWAKPAGKAKPLPKTPNAPTGEPSAPTKGATAKVWEIADGIGKPDRAAIIAACAEAGINPSTAGTQYGKWKKARGF